MALRLLFNASVAMNLLYLDPMHRCDPVESELIRAGHQVTCVREPELAMELIETNDFSAVLIAEELRDSKAFGFISHVHREQPELPVFPLCSWRFELAEELERLESHGLGSGTPQD